MKFARKITKDLTENNQFTSSILQQASEAIITVDEQGQIDLFNSAAEAMFGLRAKSAAGMSLDCLLAKMGWRRLLETVVPCHSRPIGRPSARHRRMGLDGLAGIRSGHGIAGPADAQQLPADFPAVAVGYG